MKKENKKNNGMKWVIGIVLLVLVIALIVILSKKENNYSQVGIDSFAQCLTEHGAVMYGAFWCPHCARTKARFGTSFKYITYVECDPRGENEQSELCIEKKIEAYDTWEFIDGSMVVGEPSFELLSQKSGCPAPEVG